MEKIKSTKSTKPTKSPKVKLDENLVAQNVHDVIEKLGVSATAEVSREDNADLKMPVYLVDINSEDSSLLIGKYGANLESLQFVLAVRLKTITGDDDFEIFVDVDGWRKQKEDRLVQMAQNVADKVISTNQAEALYNLRPS